MHSRLHSLYTRILLKSIQTQTQRKCKRSRGYSHFHIAYKFTSQSSYALTNHASPLSFLPSCITTAHLFPFTLSRSLCLTAMMRVVGAPRHLVPLLNQARGLTSSNHAGRWQWNVPYFQHAYLHIAVLIGSDIWVPAHIPPPRGGRSSRRAIYYSSVQENGSLQIVICAQ